MLTLSCIHTTSPWLCKKGDKYVVWILNNLVHMITVPTTLIPRFPSENVIHYADLIWIFAKLRKDEELLAGKVTTFLDMEIEFAVMYIL